jgi:hypothetical protein
MQVRRETGTRFKRLYTALWWKTIEFPPIDHDIRWVHSIINSGRSPTQVCGRRPDSDLLHRARPPPHLP